MSDLEDYEYKKSNREKRMSPKSGTIHWCGCCDRDMVYSGQKCGTCGNVDSFKRLKKE